MLLKSIVLKDYMDLHWKFRNKFLKSNVKLFRIFYYFCVRRIESKYNAETGISFHDESAKFESRPTFPHGLNGIIISRKAVIGKKCTILQQVTIGTKITSEKAVLEDDMKAPIIGDNVYIGAGAKVIGNIIVGNNVLIGANAVVTKNVPDNYTVIGNPSVMFPTKNKYR